MSDEAGKLDGTSNSMPVLREPPPSLGMVAHIWAGHLGSADSERFGACAVVEGESPAPGDDLIELAATRARPSALD
jgi:hypothetical protein